MDKIRTIRYWQESCCKGGDLPVGRFFPTAIFFRIEFWQVFQTVSHAEKRRSSSN
jgi:hypothetical protein